MANEISVDPSPIQRNRRDVALELTQLYLKHSNHTREQITEEFLCKAYDKFYKQAYECDRTKY